MPPPMNHRTACTVLAAAALAAGLSACAPLIVGSTGVGGGLAGGGVAAGLSACAPLSVGSTVVGGVRALDRRTTGTQIEDEGIELRAVNRIVAALGERAHVNVTSYNRQVLLTGEVPGAAQRQSVEQIVAAVENVRSVVNDLAVMPNSTLGQRSIDTFITGKVRA